jgi:hypothetical protein
MSDERIDFISSYCDQWCERCPLTARCSVFAVEAAIGMCGNAHEAFELALGTPRSPGAPSVDDRRFWLDDFLSTDTSSAELAAHERREAERDARIDAMPIASMSDALLHLLHGWLSVSADPLRTTGGEPVDEALAVVAHDTLLANTKLHRALDGRDRYTRDGEGDDEDPVQNDWNGSAKVALIALRRSRDAWRVIAESTDDHMPALLSREAEELQAVVEREFPDAWAFVRPGFDESDR